MTQQTDPRAVEKLGKLSTFTGLLNGLFQRFEDTPVETALRRWATAGVAIAIALSGYLSFLSWQSARRATEDADWVSHTHEVQTALTAGLGHVVDIETGARGFAATGQELFLDPYWEGQRALAQDLDTLRHLTADNFAQQKSLDRLTSQMSDRMETARSIVAERRRTGSVPPPILFVQGKQRMDAVRATVAAMQAAEGHLLDQRLERTREARRRTLILGLTSTFAGAAFLLLAGLIIRREINHAAQIRARLKALNAHLEQRVEQRTAALRESQNRLNSVIQSAMDAIITVDDQQNIVMFSLGAEKIFRCAATQALGQPIERFIPQRFRAAHASHIRKFGETRKTNRAVGALGAPLWGLRADGEEFQMEASISQVEAAGSKMFTVILRDVTARVQAAQALRQSDERRRFALETAGIGDWDLDLTTLRATRSLLHDQIFGYPSLLSEWSFDVFLGRVHPDDRENVRQNFESSVNQERRWEFECRIVRPNGDIRWIWACGDRHSGASGKAIGMFGIVKDVTDRKRTEERLRESEENYRTLFQSMDEGFCTIEVMFDPDNQPVDYRFLQANPAFEKQTGIKNGLGRRMREIAPKHEEHWFQIYGQVALTGEPIRLENEAAQLHGWYEVHAFRVGEPHEKKVGIVFNDITVRKRAEDTLREREQRIRTLLDSTAEAILGENLEGTCIFCNPASARLLGYGTPEALLGKNIHAATHHTQPNGTPLSIEDCSLALAAKTGRNFHSDDLVLWRSDGSSFPVECWSHPLLDNGEVIGSVVTFFDITERRLKEGELRESEERFRLFAEHAPAALAMFDREMRYLHVSRRWRRDFCLGECDLRGLSHYEVFPEIPERWREIHRRGLAGEVLRNESDRFERADGSVQWIRWEIRPWYDRTGGIGGIVVFSEDITERKQAADALRESEERFQAMANGIPQLAWMAEPDGHIFWYNQRWYQYTGTTFEQMEGWAWQSVHDPNMLPRVLEKWKGAIALGQPFDMEFPLRGADGVFRAFLTRVMPLRDAEGRVTRWFGTNTDISERLRAEREIRRLNDELEQRVLARTAQLQAANQELEAFTYSVSHDLRAPLRHISGFSKLLTEECGSTLAPDARHHLQRIQEGTRRMGLLVDDLLNLARLGRRDLSLRASELRPLVEEVIAELAPECAGRQIDWRIGPLPSVECDPGLVKQIFQNLLANAVKFTRTRPQAVIEVGQKEENEDVLVFVRDNGVGFDMKYADKLFGVFQRLHRTEDFEGTGVGLATVQRIVHKHGGKIWAEAELDKGATFFFGLAASRSGDRNTRAATQGAPA